MAVFLSSSQELLVLLPSTRVAFLSYNWDVLNQQFSTIAALIRDLWPRLSEGDRVYVFAPPILLRFLTLFIRSRIKACAGEALGSGKPLLLSGQKTQWV